MLLCSMAPCWALLLSHTDGNPSLAWRASKLGDQVAKKSHQLATDVQDAASDAQKKVEGLFA